MAKYKTLTIDTEDEQVFAEALANWLNNGAELISCGKNSGEYPQWYAIAKVRADIETETFVGGINGMGYREKYIGIKVGD